MSPLISLEHKLPVNIPASEMPEEQSLFARIDTLELRLKEANDELLKRENELTAAQTNLAALNDQIVEARRIIENGAEPAPATQTYQQWTYSIFGKALMPVTDTTVKGIISFDPESFYYKRYAKPLAQAEFQLTRDLLADIKLRDVPGEIVEFGIFRGDWINRLYDESQAQGLQREIWGFDSFQGLSDPDPDNDNPYWKAGMFAAGIDIVRHNVRTHERPNIKLVEGFFADSLGSDQAQSLQMVSYARIDCDIYAPTVDCLEYLTNRLTHGSILVFDDWSFDTQTGETRAFAEWVPRVPHLEFEFLFYGVWDHFYVRVWHKGQPRWEFEPGVGKIPNASKTEGFASS